MEWRSRRFSSNHPRRRWPTSPRWLGRIWLDPSRADQEVKGLASLDEAGPMHLGFFDNLKYADQLASTKAGACLVSPRFEANVPAHVAVLRAAQPFRAFVQIARELHRDALRPQSWFGYAGIAPSAIIDPSAHLEDGVIVDPLGGDRAGCRDRRGNGDRGGRCDRRPRQDRPGLQRRSAHGDPMRADRQQRADPSRLPVSGRTATASCSSVPTAT